MTEREEKPSKFLLSINAWQRRIKNLEEDLKSHPGTKSPPTMPAKKRKSRQEEGALPLLVGKVDQVESNLTRLQGSISAITEELERRHDEKAAPAASAGTSWRIWMGAVVAACGLFWGVWVYRNAGSEYSIPSSHPSALVWEGDTLWIADWFDEAVYRTINTPAGFEAVGRHLLSDTHVMGLAVAGDRLYLADSWARNIQRRRMDEELSLEASWASPGPSPSALFFDGRHLWSADKDSKRIYQHALDDDLTVLRSFDVGYEPVGLYVDDKSIWSSGSEGMLFYRHDLRTGVVLGVYELPELIPGNNPLSSFTWKGRRLWVGRDASTVLIERPWWRLRRRSRE